MTLPYPAFATAPEGYVPRSPPESCDPEPKPGVELFREFVLRNVGGGEGNISRPCDMGAPSHHHEGRAWDWSVSADDPVEAAMAENLLSWLLATDEHGEPHAMFRRAGLDYIIWDRQLWDARRRSWLPYTGWSPHEDHVHFSFSWPGARAETSFYDWLRYGPNEPAAPGEPGEVPRARPAISGPALLAAALAFGGGFWLARRRK